MKNLSKIFIVLIALTVTACDRDDSYSDKMKITGCAEISKTEGAKAVERSGDHRASPYFTSVDFYDAQSTDKLSILPKFKTLQQSSYWSCGPAAAIMVLEYYGRRGDYNEQLLARLRPQQEEQMPVSFKEMIYIFETVGSFEMITAFETDMDTKQKAVPGMLEALISDEEMMQKAVEDFIETENTKLETVENYIKSGYPILVLWNAFGPHWQVIIGYDNMGTKTKEDDVIIFADPYDTTDHNQDGYFIYPAKRFISNWTTGRFFGPDAEDNDFLFIAVKPKN